MTNSTTKVWKTFGKEDPYYGVLSDEKYRLKNIDDKGIDDFFETGWSFANETISRIDNHFKIDFSKASILDFGCGLGRLTIPFSKLTSNKVVGIDVSPDILEMAKSYALKYQSENIEYVLYDGESIPEIGQFDFINSYIVLQHIEKNIGFNLIKQMLDMLKIGGVLQIQVTYGNTLPKLKYLHYYLRSNFASYNSLYCLLKNRSLKAEPIMQMNRYDPEKMFKLLSAYSSSVHVEFTDHGGFLGASYLLRREN